MLGADRSCAVTHDDLKKRRDDLDRDIENAEQFMVWAPITILIGMALAGLIDLIGDLIK